MSKPLLVLIALVAGYFAWQEWGGRGGMPAMSVGRSGSAGDNHGAAQKINDGVKSIGD